MNYGYTGRILHVDLTNRKIDIEEQDEAFFRSHLGGRGIGYHYLMKRVPPRIDPLSSENILVLATGVVPRFYEDLQRRGEQVNMGIFREEG